MRATYSIRVVAQETGIPADTLRVWERRYGFPKPSRRPGGGRLYDEKAVARLRLLARARDAGFRPGDVILLADDAIEKLLAPAGARSSADGTAGEPFLPVDLVDLLAGIVADEVARVRSALRSLAILLGPRAFVVRVAQPLATRIGDAWEEGSLEIRQEHLASELLSTQLRILLGSLEDAESGPPIVLATFPGEHHVLGLEMVAVYLAAGLAAPRLVGANTPPAQIAGAVRAMQGAAVGISMTSDTPEARAHLIALRAALPRSTPIWLGGPAASAVATRAAIDDVLVRTTWRDLDHAVEALSSGR